jgi:hypothetical protein
LFFKFNLELSKVQTKIAEQIAQVKIDFQMTIAQPHGQIKAFQFNNA